MIIKGDGPWVLKLKYGIHKTENNLNFTKV